MNRHNFWDESKGIWTVLSENSNYFRAIETALGMQTSNEATFNFNKDGTAFYIRNEDSCIRVGSKWGQVAKCQWDLDRDTSEEVVVAVINYNKLNKNE